jgi:hypothetical protein
MALKKKLQYIYRTKNMAYFKFLFSLQTMRYHYIADLAVALKLPLRIFIILMTNNGHTGRNMLYEILQKTYF